MPGNVFDTDVLICIAFGDPLKADQAEAVLDRGGAISMQVLNEWTNVARRKIRMTWDAMIAAAALRADCDVLWSEDLQHGMTLDDRLRIVNPFRVPN